jgi:asparagine synthase (glutamine-hydrolysing)
MGGINLCGIFGTVGFQDKNLLAKMGATIKHRGPDDSGTFLDKDVALGNVRLSIIDVAHGHQPMYNEERSMAVVYNGEIYNFKDLKNELESLGHRFASDSDTEVIVHCYEEFGDSFLTKLRGMFAFAIWDARKKCLIIGRDRLGIKPLYYYLGKGFLVFGSEIKALLQYEELERKVNTEALHHFLTLSYVPGPATMFEGVRKLLPGQVLTWQLGSKEERIRVWKYWEPYFGLYEPSPETDGVAKVRALFEDAVKTHLMSEVPLGVYLSGGLDSSSIVGAMRASGENSIKTYTFGFGRSTDEFEYARLVAEYFDTDHHEFVVEPNFADDLPRIAWHLDEPIADPAVFPIYLTSKIAKKYVTVVLVGEGGDEAFAGYDKYKLFMRAKRIARSKLGLKRTIPPLLRVAARFLPTSRTKDYFKLVAEYLPQSEVEWYARLCTDGFTENEKKQLYSQSLLNATENLDTTHLFETYFEKDIGDLNRMISFDQEVWMPDRLLMKVDKMTMASSVEARVPFLDHKLMEFCNNLPPDLRIDKRIFKNAEAGLLPKAILKRKKQASSSIPLRSWLKGELGEVGKQLIDNLRKKKYFNDDYLGRLFSQIEKTKRDNQIWDLMMFEIWHELFVESDNISNPTLSLNKIC